MRDPIAQILRQTDKVIGPPTVGRDDLASTVRRRAKHQRNTRTIAGSLAVLAGIVLTITLIHRQQRPIEVAERIAHPPVVNPRSIETDERVDQLVATILASHQRKNAQLNALAADEYLWRITQQRYRAASILVRSGERIYQESHNRSAAEADYRQAIQLFPDSPAAATAREHLLDSDQKGSES